MELTLLVAVTAVPAMFWFWLFARRDVHPEPAWLLWRTFGYGMLAWVLAAALELSLSWISLAWAIVLLTALIEEGAKLLGASTAARDREFDEPIDGLIYAVTAALGFAVVENLSYGLQYGVEVAAWRGLVTMFAHALFSAPLGYGLARARFSGQRWWRTRGLLVSVALHATFNGLLTGGAWWQLGLLLVVITLMALLSNGLYARLAVRPSRHSRGPRP